MFDILPVELKCGVAEAAARLFVSEDRPLVVELALLSRAVAHVVRPILYHSVVITERNLHHFASIGPCDEVLKLSRRMSIFVIHEEPLEKILAVLQRWKPPSGGAHLDLTYNHLKLAFDGELVAANISSIVIRFQALLSAFDGPGALPVAIAQRLTHVTGYVPTLCTTGHHGYKIAALSPQVWAQTLIDRLPALTNLGLYLAGSSDSMVDLTRDDHPDDDLHIFQEILKAVHELNDRIHICIRVAGTFFVRRAVVQELIGSLVGPNLTVWYDSRPLSTWGEERARQIDDAWRRRDIFAGPPDNLLLTTASNP